MDKQHHIDTCLDESVPHLPMGQLFYLLHNNGFDVKPDDYIEMLKITERFGSKDLDETAKWICPLVATSEAEQAKFYHIIDLYKRNVSLPACHDTPQAGPPAWLKKTAIAAVSVLFIAVVYLALQKRDWTPKEQEKERKAEKGKPIFFDAYTLLKEHATDSTRLHVKWLFPDSNNVSGLRVSHVFRSAGDFLVKRVFSSSSLHILQNSDSLLVHVCDNLPEVNLRMPVEQVRVKVPVTIAADVTGNKQAVSYYQWTINDSVFNSAIPVVQNFVFTKEGDYPVECRAVVDSVSGACTAMDNEIIRVENNNTHYGARLSASTHSIEEKTAGLQWWATLALLVPAAAGFSYAMFKRNKQKVAGPVTLPPTTTITKGPYEIPFEENDIRLVQPERDLRIALLQLRNKAEEENLALSIPATIRGIIQSGGSPTLVFAPVTRQRQYLLLIDRANPKSMLTHFFRYVGKAIRQEAIPATIFYYDKGFTCYNSEYPLGISLQAVADIWHHDTLIIFGKAHELIYGVYPSMEENLLRDFLRWQSRSIITPVPLDDWSVKEKILSEHFIVLPADVQALGKLVPAFREKIIFSKELLNTTLTDRYSIKEADFRNIAQLKSYLNDDPSLFQWLCAICIYPRINWEILLETGKTILDLYGEPEKLNYTNLLKISRISWMQQGVFPQATRLELLKLLQTQNEVAARETLLHMLNYGTVLYGNDARFFQEEQRRQVLTNQFILHASDNNRYQAYAGSSDAFKKLWLNKSLLDVPVKQYLDKKSNDDWETPVSNGHHSVGLDEYFRLQAVGATTVLASRKRRTIAAASLVAAIVWVLLEFFMYPTYAGFLYYPQTASVSLKLLKNFRHCGDSSEKTFPQLSGTLEVGNKKYPLVYDPRSAVARIAVKQSLTDLPGALLRISWEAGRSIAVKLRLQNGQVPDSVTVACVNTDRIHQLGLYVRYNDAARYHVIENALTNALFRYSIDAVQVDFSDPSRIIYYEPEQKSRADSIADLVKQTLNENVKVEFISQHQTPAAAPMLFLNTSAPPNGKQDHDTPKGQSNKEDGDDHHRMADQYMVQNNYKDAVAEYSEAIRLNPKDQLAYYQRGICYEMLGDAFQQKAISDYTTAIRLKGGDVVAYYRRASVQYEMKNYADAIADYDKVIELHTAAENKQYISSLYFRGKCKLLLKDQDGACEDFKKAAAAGMAAGKKDYGNFCKLASDTVKNGKDYQQQTTPTMSDLGFLRPDNTGLYPDNASVQLIQRISTAMKDQPEGKIRLSVSYGDASTLPALQKWIAGIVQIFNGNGIDIKSRVEQVITAAHAEDYGRTNKMPVQHRVVRVTGINLNLTPPASKY